MGSQPQGHRLLDSGSRLESSQREMHTREGDWKKVSRQVSQPEKGWARYDLESKWGCSHAYLVFFFCLISSSFRGCNLICVEYSGRLPW